MSVSSRYEHEQKIDDSINRTLADLPEYMTEWNLVLKASNKTAASRRDAVSKVSAMLKYIDPDMNVAPAMITDTAVLNYYISIKSKRTDHGQVPTSDSYQQCVWTWLRNFLDFMVNSGYIDRNYMLQVKRPQNHDLERINETRPYMTAESFKRILSAVSSEENDILRKRDRAVIMVFMTTGIRREALCEITVDDIKDGTLAVIDKGRKIRNCGLTEHTIDAINDWMVARDRITPADDQQKKYLFLSLKGNRLSRNAVYSLVCKYTEKALGKRISPHKLRAGYCTILYDKTHDVEFVRRAVGHSNVRTTQRYINTNGMETEKARDLMSDI